LQAPPLAISAYLCRFSFDFDLRIYLFCPFPTFKAWSFFSEFAVIFACSIAQILLLDLAVYARKADTLASRLE